VRFLVASVRLVTVAIALATGFGALVACIQVSGREEEGSRMAGKPIDAVLKQHTDRLLSLPGVVGTAISECEGNPCIKVLVVRQTPELARWIPSALEGFPVVIEESGEIRALDPD